MQQSLEWERFTSFMRNNENKFPVLRLLVPSAKDITPQYFNKYGEDQEVGYVLVVYCEDIPAFNNRILEDNWGAAMRGVMRLEHNHLFEPFLKYEVFFKKEQDMRNLSQDEIISLKRYISEIMEMKGCFLTYSGSNEILATGIDDGTYPDGFYMIAAPTEPEKGKNTVVYSTNSSLTIKPSINAVLSRLHAFIVFKPYVVSLVFALMSRNEGKFFIPRRLPCPAVLRRYASLPL